MAAIPYNTVFYINLQGGREMAISSMIDCLVISDDDERVEAKEERVKALMLGR